MISVKILLEMMIEIINNIEKSSFALKERGGYHIIDEKDSISYSFPGEEVFIPDLPIYLADVIGRYQFLIPMISVINVFYKGGVDEMKIGSSARKIIVNVTIRNKEISDEFERGIFRR